MSAERTFCPLCRRRTVTLRSRPRGESHLGCARSACEFIAWVDPARYLLSGNRGWLLAWQRRNNQYAERFIVDPILVRQRLDRQLRTQVQQWWSWGSVIETNYTTAATTFATAATNLQTWHTTISMTA